MSIMVRLTKKNFIITIIIIIASITTVITVQWLPSRGSLPVTQKRYILVLVSEDIAEPTKLSL